MTTLTKKELMEKVATLQWERAGFRETIRNREAMIRNAVAEGKKREEELTESWVLDSNKAIAYIHELQNEKEEEVEKVFALKNEIENYKQTIQNREFKLVDAADKYAELEQHYESMYNKRNIEMDKLAAGKESASYWHDEWLALSEEIAVLQDK